MKFFDYFIIIIIIISSLHSFYKKSLTLAGSILAASIGCILYFSNGYTFLVPLFAFYISSRLITKFKSSKKDYLRDVNEKFGTRDIIQVISNGATASILALIFILLKEETIIAALFVSFSVCTSDTWSSEIGTLSSKKPFSIINFKTLPTGISGGVSLLGTCAAFTGALFIGLLYFIIKYNELQFNICLYNSFIIVISGFLGSILDSILGALFQPLYYDSKKNLYTEKYSFNNDLVKIKGYKIFTNDFVNFLSTFVITFSTLIILK